MKKLICLITAVCCMLAVLPVSAAVMVSGGNDNGIIWAEDFSGPSLTGKYGVTSGELSGGKYVMDLTGSAKEAARLLRTVVPGEDYITFQSGTYSVQADFEFETISSVLRLMGTGENTTGLHYAYQFYVTSGGMLALKYCDAASAAKNADIMQLAVNTKYTLKAVFSLETEELCVYVNGERVLTDRQLYVDPSVAALSGTNLNNINRLFDSEANKSNNDMGKYTIDNIVFKRDVITNDMYNAVNVFTENFDTTTNDYAANFVSKISDSDLEKGIGIDGKAAYMSGASNGRITVNPNGFSGLFGIVSTSVDFYLNSISGTGSVEIMQVQNSTRDGTNYKNDRARDLAYRVYEKNNNLYIEAVKRFTLDENGQQLVTEAVDWPLGAVEAENWYNVKVDYNPETLIMKVYVNDELKNASQPLYVYKQNNYKTAFSCDNRSAAYVDLYLDNITINCTTPWDREHQYREYVSRDEFNSFGTFTNIKNAVIENGRLKIAAGMRSLSTLSSNIPTSGVYSASADLQFAVKNTISTDDKIRLISAQSLVDTTNAYHFWLYEENGSLYARVYTKSGDKTVGRYIELMNNIDTSKVYNFRYSLNLNTRRIHFYIDGFEAASDIIMYSNPDAAQNIARPFDFEGRFNYNGVMYIDNYMLYKDNFAAKIDNFDSAVIKTSSINLPSQTADGSPIVWLSSNMNSINPLTGEVNLPALYDEYVTLTARTTDTYCKKAAYEYTMTLRPDRMDITLTADDSSITAEAVVYSLENENKIMYLALYKDGVLYSIQKTGTDFQGKMTIEKAFDSLEAGEYTARGFLWQSADTVKPYCATDLRSISIK